MDIIFNLCTFDSIKNKELKKQVEWELYGLENASIIVYFFAPNTISPITLLELGLYLKTDKIIICCPEGYERKGNIGYDIALIRKGFNSAC